MEFRIVNKNKLFLIIVLLLSSASQADDADKSVSACKPHIKPISLGLNPNNLTDFREEGKVLVQLIVTTDGKVIEPAIIESSNPKLNALALKAAAQFRFKPSKQSCLFKIPMKFTEA